MTCPIERSLLIQCQSCGIENIFDSYAAERLVVCNQCRDRLIEPNFAEAFNQFDCRDCGFSVFLLKKTPFIVGEAACRCGSRNLQQIEKVSLYDEAKAAGAYKDDNGPLNDDDWYRSEPVSEDKLDYNDLFDNDLGRN